jgi:hypothetical protein
MNANDVRELLRERVKAAGSQYKLAAAIGVDYGHLNAAVNGRCAPGPKILRALGLRRVFLYEVVVVAEEAPPP